MLQTALCRAGSLRGTQPGQSYQKGYYPGKQPIVFLLVYFWWIFSFYRLNLGGLSASYETTNVDGLINNVVAGFIPA
jgi:hypothetical protein